MAKTTSLDLEIYKISRILTTVSLTSASLACSCAAISLTLKGYFTSAIILMSMAAIAALAAITVHRRVSRAICEIESCRERTSRASDADIQSEAKS